MASEFLNQLKETVETGDFNSEAAKKILEINELVDTNSFQRKSLRDKEIEGGLTPELVESLTPEEAEIINIASEKKMADIKKQDTINQQLAILFEIEDMIKASIDDMFTFTDELESNFAKEFESEDPMFGELYQKIESLKSKYNSQIN